MSQSRIDKLKAFLERDPNDSFSHYALALEYAALGDTNQGIEVLEQLLQRDPTYVATYQQLGYLYAKVFREAEAVAVLKRGIQVATQQNDFHARTEMEDALDELAS